MKKIVFFMLMLAFSLTSVAQSYQVSKYKVERNQNSWTEWYPVSAQIGIDFESKTVTIQHEKALFQFRITLIGEIYNVSDFRIVDMMTVDLDQKLHRLSIMSSTSGESFVQIDDYTNHRIIYKLK